MLERGRLAKFDYGPKDNFKLYGQKSAPEINIEEISVRTAMFVGELDDLGDLKDNI